MNKTVIFNNDLNKLNLGILTKVSHNLFMALLFFVKDHGSNIIQIPFRELRKNAHFTRTSTQSLSEALQTLLDQLLSINAKIIEKTPSGKNHIKCFNLFSHYEIFEDFGYLEIGVNEKYVYLLNDFIKNYTKLDLDEVAAFKGIYTKNIFRLLIQWNSIGMFQLNGDMLPDFFEKIGAPANYSNARIIQRCVKPAIQEINSSGCSLKNLAFIPEYSSRQGNPLKSIIFKWDIPIPETRDDKHVPDTSSMVRVIKDSLRNKIPEITEEGILSMAKAADKNHRTEADVKNIIDYATHKEHTDNFVGYVIGLMKNGFSKPVAHNGVKNHDYEQRTYTDAEMKALELKKLGVKE